MSAMVDVHCCNANVYFHHLEAIAVPILYTNHIIYVYIMGIPIYNLVIAVFSDTVIDVYVHRHPLLAHCQLWITEGLLTSITNSPMRSVGLRLYTHKLKYMFVSEGERLYLVMRKSAVKPKHNDGKLLCDNCWKAVKN